MFSIIKRWTFFFLVLFTFCLSFVFCFCFVFRLITVYFFNIVCFLIFIDVYFGSLTSYGFSSYFAIA